ncbi:Eco57I restriction-modification methylase domain-containing protein [Nocardia sp. NPDC058176]|uniref:Eco57I restriction-modification methylase domain-containing protein n=1 Tax=Nocardia sp. NPDC058176 TaxID=3346368 RepID=UPI0036DA39B5
MASHARDAQERKRHGRHYTPPELARFLARRALLHAPHAEELRVLDPACGDGELLLAVHRELAAHVPEMAVRLTGYDLDRRAVGETAERAAAEGVEIDCRAGDFLTASARLADDSFDLIITNPPYVRTQQLGGATAQLLSRQFGLRGRIDLTHPFVAVAPRLLTADGVLGLLCANRFLTTRAGANLRHILTTDLTPVELYDLGDTKLFTAAVLPAITVATRAPCRQDCRYVSVYEEPGTEPDCDTDLFDALAGDRPCSVRDCGRVFAVEVGVLCTGHAEAGGGLPGESSGVTLPGVTGPVASSPEVTGSVGSSPGVTGPVGSSPGVTGPVGSSPGELSANATLRVEASPGVAVQVPGVPGPGVAEPGVALVVPGVAGRDVAELGVAEPGVAGPGVGSVVPGVAGPGVAGPGVAGPGVAMPVPVDGGCGEEVSAGGSNAALLSAEVVANSTGESALRADMRTVLSAGVRSPGTGRAGGGRGSRADAAWRMSRPGVDRWLARIAERTWRSFGEAARIRVGIKTTADRVFISDRWEQMEPMPEPELLRQLITHHDLQPWRVAMARGTKVLYPYDLRQPRRTPIDLAEFPGAAGYLRSHEQVLAGRRYVVDSGREWFEIWVPQRPHLWGAPKLVFPDISERPRFALDRSGAVVNGDCYWISLTDLGAGKAATELAYLLMGVANSALGLRFYDAVCGNRLYSGRRRWITQYVARLPVPDPARPAAAEIVRKVRSVLEDGVPVPDAGIDEVVAAAFGVQ